MTEIEVLRSLREKQIQEMKDRARKERSGEILVPRIGQILYLPIGGVPTKSTESTKIGRKVLAVLAVSVGRGGIGE